MNLSDSKIEANRANAAKSTGPKTPEGKRKSAANATRHGLYSRAIVLQSEDPAEFHHTLCNNVELYMPMTEAQLRIVNDITCAQWRLRRAEKFETGVIDEAEAAPGGEKISAVLVAIGPDLERITRYERSLLRKIEALQEQFVFQESLYNAASETEHKLTDLMLDALDDLSEDEQDRLILGETVINFRDANVGNGHDLGTLGSADFTKTKPATGEDAVEEDSISGNDQGMATYEMLRDPHAWLEALESRVERSFAEQADLCEEQR